MLLRSQSGAADAARDSRGISRNIMDIIYNMNKKHIPTVVLSLFLFVTLAFIWGNSIQSIEASQALSLGVLEKIKPLLEVVTGAGRATDHLVRKLAHFTEFAALGAELALLLMLAGRVRPQPAVNCAFLGLVVALLDETIQIFSHRGAQIQDVWIDFAGLCAGLLGTLGLRLLIKAMRAQPGKGGSA